MRSLVIVHIFRTVDQTITKFTVNGHADYAPRGKDIVCAGVSAVTIGTVNAIKHLTTVDINILMENGHLSVDLLSAFDIDQFANAQLLLESMVIMLSGISDEYSKYVKIQQTIAEK